MINSRLQFHSAAGASAKNSKRSHRRITSETIPQQFVADDFTNDTFSITELVAAEKTFESAGNQVQQIDWIKEDDEGRGEDRIGYSENFLGLNKNSTSNATTVFASQDILKRRGQQKWQQRRKIGVQALAITCASTDKVSGVESTGTQSSTISNKIIAFSNQNLLAKRLPSTYIVSKDINLSKPRFSTQVLNRQKQRRQRPLTGNPRINQSRENEFSTATIREEVCQVAVPHCRRPVSSKLSIGNFSNQEFSTNKLGEASGSFLLSSKQKPSESASIKHKRAISASTYKSRLLQPVLESTSTSVVRMSIRESKKNMVSCSSEPASYLKKNQVGTRGPSGNDSMDCKVKKFTVCPSRRVPIKSLALTKWRQASQNEAQSPQQRTFLPLGAKSKTQKATTATCLSSKAVQSTDSDQQQELLMKLENQKLEVEDANLKKHLQEVINMLKLKQVPMAQLYNWSLNNSKVVKRVHRSFQTHQKALHQLRQQSRHYQMLSQKRTDLYKTRAELREQEMSGEIRKFILASDPQLIPDSFIAPEPEGSLNVKFFKAGKPNKLLTVKPDRWVAMGAHRR